MPYGRDVLSLSMACRAYHATLERILYVRFATMPTVSHEDRWTTISSRKAQQKLRRRRRRAIEHSNVFMWAVYNNRKESLQKLFKIFRQDFLYPARRRGQDFCAHLRNSITAAYLEAAKESQVEMLEIFLQNAREHVEVLDLIRQSNPLRLSNVQLALKYGLDVSDNPEALIKAMGVDDIEVARLLLDSGADPNHSPDAEPSVIFLAAKRNDVHFLQLLVDYGADLNQACATTQSPNRGVQNLADDRARFRSPVVSAACVARNTKCLEFLIDNNYFNPAAGEVCRVFLENLCFIEDMFDRDRRLSFREEMEWLRRLHKQRKGALKLLINRGLNVASYVFGYPLLSWAASMDIGEIVELLLQNGATVDVLDRAGLTPLVHVFARVQPRNENPCSVPALNLLVDAGASLNSFESSFTTPLCAIIRRRSGAFHYLLGSLRSGANFAKNDTAQKRFKTSAEYMQATLDDGGSDGFMPLMIAAQDGHHTFTHALLEAGANVNLGGAHGQTPLHMAVKSVKESVCRLLLSYGADAHQRDGEGRDAFSHADNARWFVKLVNIEHARRRQAAMDAAEALQAESST